MYIPVVERTGSETEFRSRCPLQASLLLPREGEKGRERETEMVEVLLDRNDGQEVVIAESDCIPESPAECPPSPRNVQSSDGVGQLTPVQEFYRGQSIFITGGTGFMGKLLIEKLLRSCPGIASIYLLMRPKKGKDVHQRAEEIFDDPVSPLSVLHAGIHPPPSSRAYFGIPPSFLFFSVFFFFSFFSIKPILNDL